MRRVLFVVHGLPPHRVGGAELVVWRAARTLASAGREVAVLHRDDAADARIGVLIRARRHAVTRYGLGVLPDRDESPHAREAAARVLTLWRPDAVWIHHLSGLALDVLELVLRDRIPLLVTFHDYWWMCPRGQLVDRAGSRCPGPARERCPACLAPGAPLPLRPWSRAVAERSWQRRQRRVAHILSQAWRMMAPSAHVADRHTAWLGRPGSVEVVENPAPTLSPVPLPPPSGPLRIGFFGTLLPTKGIELLLHAHRQHADRVDLQLHGPLPTGAVWQAWRRHVRELAAASGATLVGPYAPSDVAARLAEVELVALPSTWEENAPVVLDEALAARRRVLASDQGGIPERLPPAVGRLLPAGDEHAWTAALADTVALRRWARAPWPDAAAPRTTPTLVDVLHDLDRCRVD